MSLVIESPPVPLEADQDGVVRVGHTRVTLETVLGAFQDGATAEEIVWQYPSLSLADVYAVIGYYLQRQAEVEVYLRQREEMAQQTREQNMVRFHQQGLRERLLARRAQTGRVNHASTGR